MAEEHPIIDLDDRDRARVTRDEGPRRRRLINRAASAYAIGAFVLGVAVGGIGVAEVQDSRDARTPAAAVAVVVIASSASGGGELSGSTARFDAQLTAVNAGPQPVTVRAIGVRLPGTVIDAAAQFRRLRPGEIGVMDVRVMMHCSVKPDPVPMRLSVETADHRTREVSYPMAYTGTAWQNRAVLLCGQGG
ncbi:hypothetical protein [Micromonospora sp. WMMD998]|uniref:hypothetical protein n=1 Tax=Micromonospora sp. WMMD998 TaxID=3016092 RepID=UPI00249A914E|nr:hypothetical protein [Micromonospora sp. WMMD998]WFE38083.1 hypothetical protein O7619_06410 [Micromonospora sp. WMMD998]